MPLLPVCFLASANKRLIRGDSFRSRRQESPSEPDYKDSKVRLSMSQHQRKDDGDPYMIVVQRYKNTNYRTIFVNHLLAAHDNYIILIYSRIICAIGKTIYMGSGIR